MPIIIVYGIPSNTTGNRIERFSDSLIKLTCRIPELNLTEDQVSYLFPRDMMDWVESPDEIFIFVEGLFDKPERTEDVRKKLAQTLVDCAIGHFRQAKLVECFIKPFDPRLGFACSTKTKK